MTNPYGYELILDLHGCDVSKFTRRHFRKYYKVLCEAIDMQRCKLVFWDDQWWRKLFLPWTCQKLPHTTGTSAVQFIVTSSVLIHALDILGAAYINIFSCKQFDPEQAQTITKEWFGAEICQSRLIERI